MAFRLKPIVYVQLRVGSLEMWDVDTDEHYQIHTSCLSHPRTLFKSLSELAKIFHCGLRSVLRDRFLPLKPHVVIHPLERLEGGLTEMETRALRDAAVRAGAYRVYIWMGEPIPLDNFNKKQFSGGYWDSEPPGW